MVEIEEEAKKSCRVNMFAFDFSKTCSLASLIEASFFLGTSSDMVLMSIQEPIPDNYSLPDLTIVWHQFLHLAEYSGVCVFTDWRHALQHSKQIVEETKIEQQRIFQCESRCQTLREACLVHSIDDFNQFLHRLAKEDADSMNQTQIKYWMRKLKLGPLWPFASKVRSKTMTPVEFTRVCANYLTQVVPLDPTGLPDPPVADSPAISVGQVSNIRVSNERPSLATDRRRQSTHSSPVIKIESGKMVVDESDLKGSIVYVAGLSDAPVLADAERLWNSCDKSKVQLLHFGTGCRMNSSFSVTQWVEQLCSLQRRPLIYVVECYNTYNLVCLSVMIEVAYALGAGFPMVLCFLTDPPARPDYCRSEVVDHVDENKDVVVDFMPSSRHKFGRLRSVSESSSTAEFLAHSPLTSNLSTLGRGDFYAQRYIDQVDAGSGRTIVRPRDMFAAPKLGMYLGHSSQDSGIASSSDMSPVDCPDDQCTIPTTNIADDEVFDWVLVKENEEDLQCLSNFDLLLKGIDRATAYLESMARQKNIPVVRSLTEAIQLSL